MTSIVGCDIDGEPQSGLLRVGGRTTNPHADDTSSARGCSSVHTSARVTWPV